jgi:K+/H+ antiporter YhaU regulatory subunit KhtT
MRFNPTFRSTVKAGDTLIALGDRAKLRILEEMASSGKK